jgi:Tol biopolymer transport system component
MRGYLRQLSWIILKLSLTLMVVTSGAMAGPVRLISLRDPAQPAPAGGNGDSFSPIMSPDGRFILFASTANNLVTNKNGNPLPVTASPRLNVFLRDRVNGTTSLASVNLGGTGGGNGDSLPTAVSPDGRFALFESIASDLVPGGTNGFTEIYLHDFLLGTNLLVSVNTNGNPAKGLCRGSVMTPDGRYVAFVSAATNLVAGDTNNLADVFVRDVVGGVTTLVSAGAKQNLSSGLISSSESPEITADGRYGAFYSTATNLVPGIPGAGTVYVTDLIAGTTIAASTNANAIAQSILLTTNIASYNHRMSADGQYVAFETSSNAAALNAGLIFRVNLATGVADLVSSNAYVMPTAHFEDAHNLDMTPDGRFIAFVAYVTNNVPGFPARALFLWDAQSALTQLVSGDLTNGVTAGSVCDWPVMDSSGRYVAFVTDATNLVSNSIAGDYHLYVRDVLAGTTALLDMDTNGVGTGVGFATAPRMSTNGLLFAFESSDSTLIPDDRNHDLDVLIRDISTNVSELVSARLPLLSSASPNGQSVLSGLSVSRDGRYIAFSSDADNLVSNDMNGVRDVFVRDLLTESNLLVSANMGGLPADNISGEPVISGDGRFVAFTSSADDIVPGDSNGASDVFLRDMVSGQTQLVSLDTNGVGSANGPSYAPAISLDGRYVLFRSRSSNLASGNFGTNENLFMRDVQKGTTSALTTSGVLGVSMTPDGQFVGFGLARSNLYVWSATTGAVIYTNSTPPVSSLRISPDGNRVVYTNAAGFYGMDRALGSNWLILGFVNQTHLGMRFTSDSRFVPYSEWVGVGTFFVYVYDFQTRTSLQISRGYMSGTPYGISDSPDISPDGRLVAFRSAATNLLASPDGNGVPDVFVFDIGTAKTSLISSNWVSGVTADNRSGLPLFSGDGRTLFFQSWASDLVPLDLNSGGDVFSLAFLYAAISPGTGGLGPTITWPARPCETYHVQYKNSLGEPTWLDVSGTVTIMGYRAELTDQAPSADARFYRVSAAKQ